MKKRTIGILATGVAVCALCIVTDASAIAGGGHGGGGGGGHGGGGGGHGGGGVAGGFSRRRWGLGLRRRGGPLRPWPTWVKGGVAVHRAPTAGLTRIQHLLVTLLIISVTTTQ